MMPDKQIIQHFFSGFLSVFRLGAIDIKRPRIQDISDYVFTAEDYINAAYRNLKNEHERN